jgi:biopolymer transport protein ExbD
MADKKQRLFDVWIVESNTVYRQVPYSVVTDWAQEGRLLGDDRLRISGTEKWVLLGEVPAFRAFLPQVEPHRAEDQAEALELVQVDFTWQPRHDDDDDVDMIPLIDISLVLLIFFMMTAAVATAGSVFKTPQAEFMLLTINPQMYWIGIHYKDGKESYSLGKSEAGEGQQYDSQDQLLKTLADTIQEEKGPVEVRIRADRDLPAEVVIQQLTPKLEKFRRQGKLRKVYIEVSQKEGR